MSADFSYIEKMPPEIASEMLLNLPVKDVLSYCAGSSNLSSLCGDRYLWKRLFQRDYTFLFENGLLDTSTDRYGDDWYEKYVQTYRTHPRSDRFVAWAFKRQGVVLSDRQVVRLTGLFGPLFSRLSELERRGEPRRLFADKVFNTQVGEWYPRSEAELYYDAFDQNKATFDDVRLALVYAVVVVVADQARRHGGPNTDVAAWILNPLNHTEIMKMIFRGATTHGGSLQTLIQTALEDVPGLPRLPW